ncbi:hypothetical protein FACS1894172_01100 [Spirochaetia bacterium]|nr:hypothetical protein FACS1894164_06780 [Spirochaetia bacterium]GHU29615.1 hypothetical protein FACS1894172_01100 [Spirochaetia bacterium]
MYISIEELDNIISFFGHTKRIMKQDIKNFNYEHYRDYSGNLYNGSDYRNSIFC